MSLWPSPYAEKAYQRIKNDKTNPCDMDHVFTEHIRPCNRNSRNFYNFEADIEIPPRRKILDRLERSRILIRPVFDLMLCAQPRTFKTR